MAEDRTIVERAFELARSGRVANLRSLEKVLKAERFDAVENQLQGRSLRIQLRQLIAEARAAAPPA